MTMNKNYTWVPLNQPEPVFKISYPKPTPLPFKPAMIKLYKNNTQKPAD